MQAAEISIYDITAPDPFTIRFSANRKDLTAIIQICEKRGDRIDVEGVTGYIYTALRILKRPVFLAGFCVWLFLALWLPTKILFVNVSGADTLPENYILECAADCGIRMGATGKDVRSEKMKNALLAKIPDLQWAGVNTNGCIATINVSEKVIEDSSSPNIALTDILSSQDAIVCEITVQAGTALCQTGQAVKKGQALISCYRDNGQFLEFTGAGGEVYGETKRVLQAVTPLQVHKKKEILSAEKNFYVIIGKKPIKFQKHSGILDGSCVKMYEVKECVLPGGFALPIWLVTEYITTYALEPVTLTDTDCSWLTNYTQSYLESNLIAGNIQSTNIVTDLTNYTYSVLGTYHCREMIADFEHKGFTNKNGENN